MKVARYADEAEFHTDRDHVESLDRFGFRCEILGGNAFCDLEPALTTKISKALLFPFNRSISDPYKLVLRLSEKYQELGGVGHPRVSRLRGKKDVVVGFASGRNEPNVLCTTVFRGNCRVGKLVSPR